MQYRDVNVQPVMAVVNTGTATIDLDVTSPLTELSVVMALTNGGAALNGQLIPRIVQRIELVDGGTVYSSLSGPQLAADFFYNTGRYPPHWMDEAANAGQNFTFPMRFGRYLGDPLRNFDPTKLRNPQIRVTWAADPLHLAGSLTLGIRAKIMEGVPGASSCLFTTDVRDFVTVAAGIDVTELPTDLVIRRLYVAPWLALTAPAAIINWYRLDCDEGKFIAFDRSGWDCIEDIEQAFGYCRTRVHVNANNAQTKDVCIGNTMGASVARADGTRFICAWCSGSNWAAPHGATDAGVLIANIPCEILTYGSLPHSVLGFGFGVPDDPASWLNAAAYRKIKLLLTQGIAGATCSLLVQQDRPL